MKKGNFYIACRDGNKSVKILVSGYVFTTGGIAFGVYKPKATNFCSTYWRSVDIDTGLAVIYARTRQECVEQTEENFKRFMEVKAKSKFTHQWLESLEIKDKLS